MKKQTKPSIARENADLRRRIVMLEAVVQRLTAQPVTQVVSMPCPGPHYPAPSVNPYPAYQYPWPWGTATICGAPPVVPLTIDAGVSYNAPDAVRAGLVVNNAGCAAPFLGTEAFQWNAGPGAIGTTS